MSIRVFGEVRLTPSGARLRCHTVSVYCANKMGQKLTGSIWQERPRVRAQQVRRTCEALEQTYGRPRLGNPQNPLDDLVYTILSNKTAPDCASETYRRVKKRFRSWDAVLAAPAPTLQRILAPGGLSHVKTRQIRGALRRIARDYGRCTLNGLKGRSVEDAQRYLETLPGVSTKVAKCVLMYTMGAEALPVDSHVHRIARRLGWIDRKRADQSHEELESLISPHRRYAFHVDCLAHGRAVCRPTNPACERCCVSRHCKYFREHDG